jgi:cytochrome P450
MESERFPSGPRLPSAVQTAWLVYRPYRFLERCRDVHGDAFTIRTPVGRIPMFARPDLVEQVFALDGDALHFGAAAAPLVAFAGDRSLMKLDGPDHQRHRAILSSVLRFSDQPKECDRAIERIRRNVASWPIGRRFDLGAELDRLAIDLSTELALGVASADLAAATRRTIRLLRKASSPAQLLRRLLGLGANCEFVRAREVIEAHLGRRIASEHRSQNSRCVFQRLLQWRDGDAGRLDAPDVVDETMTIYFAMVAGLSCSMKHTFEWALRTPGVASRIRSATARASAAGDPRAVVAEPYLGAVCKEVLRLCPDIPFTLRRAAVDVAIGPWRLPAGTTLGVGIHLLHRREESFHEAGRFRPERFLTARPSRFEYLPFGGGRRGCVAGSLFPFYQKLILAAVLERLDIELCDRRDNPVTSLALVSTPSRPLWAIARPTAVGRLSTSGELLTALMPRRPRPRTRFMSSRKKGKPRP